MKPNANVACVLCKKQKKLHESVPAELIRPGVVDAIKKEHPGWDSIGFVCLHCLNKFRGQYVQEVLEDERGQLSQLEEQVVKSLEEQQAIAENLNEEFDARTTFAERIADRVAEFGGSWTFIIFFGAVITVWIAVNSVQFYKPFDPAPFIGLNLILSCLAALQAPVIMMSQNRQDAKDRMRADQDFGTNLKAELEIRHLNAKMDILLTHQWQKLLEIQRIQMELMQELAHAKRSGPSRSPRPITVNSVPEIVTEQLLERMSEEMRAEAIVDEAARAVLDIQGVAPADGNGHSSAVAVPEAASVEPPPTTLPMPAASKGRSVRRRE